MVIYVFSTLMAKFMTDLRPMVEPKLMAGSKLTVGLIYAVLSQQDPLLRFGDNCLLEVASRLRQDAAVQGGSRLE